MFDVHKSSRLYIGIPYSGPASAGKPMRFEILEEAIKAKNELNRANPVGFTIYDTLTLKEVIVPT